MKKFSDFATGDASLTGDKTKLDDILGKEIVIKGYKVAVSKYNDGQVLTLQFDLEDKEYIIFTGSSVLVNQIEKYKDEIPFITKIEQINKFNKNIIK
ncbi:hypothetical protein [Clostridium sp.]|uniref:hypothetical protein n=1 Tax=Clostridium sp. TaxID=1506 RepID=UPI001A543272|nr:hypothetical protein [Clostridium sp.]MBK5239846.1 hypothetical protein [Clostridium sp.]